MVSVTALQLLQKQMMHAQGVYTQPEIGLCNGAVGRVYQIVYNEGQHPPNFPVAVIVHFEKYAGPPFIHEHPKCIPVPPITFEWGYTNNLSKQQFPL